MTPLLTYKGAVLPWHCDEMGHMNVMWYVGKFDEATRHLFCALDLTPNFLRDNNRGMAAVEQNIQYNANCSQAISLRSRRALRTSSTG
jgi:acyl-CoA thioester hydrolase